MDRSPRDPLNSKHHRCAVCGVTFDSAVALNAHTGSHKERLPGSGFAAPRPTTAREAWELLTSTVRDGGDPTDIDAATTLFTAALVRANRRTLV
jgi:hypothetical protein